jgi:hypothetical protein
MRRRYEAAARRDRPAVLGLYDPRVELDLSHVPLRAMTGQQLYRGHDGLRSLFRAWHGKVVRVAWFASLEEARAAAATDAR